MEGPSLRKRRATHSSSAAGRHRPIRRWQKSKRKTKQPIRFYFAYKRQSVDWQWSASRSDATHDQRRFHHHFRGIPGEPHGFKVPKNSESCFITSPKAANPDCRATAASPPSLPDARPRSDRFRCGGRERKFHAKFRLFRLTIRTGSSSLLLFGALHHCVAHV